MKNLGLRSFLNNHSILKGYLLAFLATLGMSNVYIFSKAALSEIHIIQFGFYWFGFALIWILIYIISSKKIRLVRHLNKRSWFLLIIIGLFELIAATSMFLAIRAVENPAVVSFLSNLTPIFVTVLGISLLAERFNLIEGIGIVLTIMGAIVISYSKESGLDALFSEGTGWIILSSFFMSISIVIAKSRIVQIDPSILTLNRIVYLFIFSGIMIITTQKTLNINSTAMFNMAAGSLLGPFMTALSQYSALKYIEASRTMIIQSTRGMFVIVGAIIYLNVIPEPFQIIGGIIIIIGVIIMTLGKSKILSRKTMRPEIRKQV